jgi:ppGpp synthetase/RelA/SpoT-type nucleotidyltranferase
MSEPPWSTNQLKKLGFCIRDETLVPSSLPSYDEVMVFYNDLAADAQARIAGLDWGPLLGDRIPEVTSRPKTIDTLRQKLQRDRSTPLPSVQDIAGVRFEAEMTLDEQDAVANAIAGLFGHDLAACTRDLRDNPHSGYRAVHLWLRLPGRVEVQIRTHIQGQWANTYEAVADVLGRGIRYGEMPEDKKSAQLVVALQDLSKHAISILEEGRVKIRRTLDRIEKAHKVNALASDLTDLRAMEADLNDLEHEIQANLLELQRQYDKIRHAPKG